MNPAPPAVNTARLAGLDIFRGLAVAGMILVNNPGSGQYVWWPLDHAAWHGFTPTDLVFPAFLCAVGFAIALPFPRTIDRAEAWRRVIRRSLALYAIGAVFALLSRPDLAHLRVFGVLQRIALCSAIVGSSALLTARPGPDGRHALSPTTFVAAAAGVLALWWTLLTLVPVPGYGAGQLTSEGNIGGFVDRALFTTDHIWRHGKDAAGNVVYDPEGLLSTLGALGNVLLGAAAAIWWKRGVGIGRVALASLVLTGVGLALTIVQPLNKALWTSSFAVFTSGLSGLLFAAAVVVGDTRLTTPFRILGANALLAFCLSLLIGIFGIKSGVPAWAFARIDAFIGTPMVASALYGLIVLAATFALVFPLHRRGLHLRL